MSNHPPVLLDMDGTLVDSAIVVERTWRDFADDHGLSAQRVLEFAHGRPTAMTVSHFLDDPELAARETRRITAAEEVTTDGIRQIAGAGRFLAELTAGRWAVVTSAGRTLARTRLTAAGLPIPDVLICAEDIDRGKPDPQGYLLAARHLGVDIGGCVVFEDSPAGIEAGVASGASVIVVSAEDAHPGLALPRVSDFVGLEPGFLHVAQETS